MAYTPSGVSVLGLHLGIVDAQGFLVAQNNSSGQLDIFIQGITGSPRNVFTTTAPVQNTNIANLTGSNFDFSFNSGNIYLGTRVPFWSPSQFLPQGGETNIYWTGNPIAEKNAGLVIYGQDKDGGPDGGVDIKIRKAFEDKYVEVGNALGETVILNTSYGPTTYRTFGFPGVMMSQYANVFETQEFNTVLDPSSFDNSLFYGYQWLFYGGADIMVKPFAVYESHVEVGHASPNAETEFLNGNGYLYLRNSPNPPTNSPTGGAALYASGNTLAVRSSQGTVQLSPGITGVDRIKMAASAYNFISSSRSLTDNDNGRTLILRNPTSYILTVPDTITRPFKCQINSEGGTVLPTAIVGGGTMSVYNKDSQFNTAGPWSVCHIEVRIANEAILYGDTQA